MTLAMGYLPRVIEGTRMVFPMEELSMDFTVCCDIQVTRLF